MPDRIERQSTRFLAGARIAGAAARQARLLTRLAGELLPLIAQPAAHRPHFDDDRTADQLATGAQPLVAVGDEETAPDPNDGDRREAIAALHGGAVLGD